MTRRLRALFPVLLILCAPLVLSGWTMVAVGAQTQSAQAAGHLPGDPTKGQQLFSSGTCSSCHGANLEGGIGPALNPITHLGNTHNPLDPAYLESTITNGLSGAGGYSASMPPKGGDNSLTQQDIADLAAFIIQSNQSGQVTLSPVDLARSNVFWVTTTLFLLILLTFLLSRYNMRWIARRAEVRRQRSRRQP
ncbi:MAG: cytochrome c [Candidatus Dormibacteraeota bacterium]|nr:cytochrome c [Candidatus Dormibacteraeota bacterium]